MFLFCLSFGTFNSSLSASSVDQNDNLMNKIAKDFSKKFCNGVGFGLSQESAMNFAIKENLETFKNKKGIENINKRILAEKISNSVLDKCGYSLDLTEYG